jgi:predicted nucleotidyltransferase
MKEKIIVKMLFGSHLYGTATEKSDTDYKGIFLPSKKDLILGRVPKSINASTGNNNSKNSSVDTDIEFYSLPYFIKLAIEGQTVALDMLHANASNIIGNSQYSAIWDSIVAERKRFYTKNLNAFVGYARKQAAKYGVKGSRLAAAKKIIAMLSVMDPNQKLSALWHILPVSEHLYHIQQSPNGIRQYQICGKTVQETQTVVYTLKMLNKFYTEYGHRAIEAAKNKGIDWKAVSHAVRAALQVKELLTEGTITFPLKEAELILNIKSGKMDYLTEVSPTLENLMEEVEVLSKTSTLPEKVDIDYWEDFIIRIMYDYVL